MDKHKKAITPRVVIQLLIVLLLIPCLPLLITRRWDWWEAWIYAVLLILAFGMSRWLASRRHPDLLRERAGFMQLENVQTWDRWLAPLVGVGSGLLPSAAAFEHFLSPPSSFSPWIKILALLTIIAGYSLATYALMENRFFSGVVRLQTERGHHAVTGGPYRWVRHPGYAGSLMTYFVIPLWMDSWWTFVPAVLLAAVLVLRTSLEDRFLQENLPGYADYAARVRYRLLPGVW
jgi:protein-S-isoprenylcysteine O-methyltransferase Ste14